MERNPLSLVQEYLDRPEPKVRRNVAAALAAIGSGESISKLVDMACSDPDPEVRDRAEEELASLDGPAVGLIRETLYGGLDAGSRDKRRSAYAVLGRLRERGALVNGAPAFSEERLARVIEIAGSDPDPKLRGHAEAELAQLRDQAAAQASAMLYQQLKQGDEESRRSSYWLLSRLRRRGLPVRLGFFKRLRLAFSLRPKGPGSSGGQMFVTGLQGGLVAALILILYLVLTLELRPTGSTSAFIAALFVSVPILAALLAALATRRAVPIDRQPDRKAAAVIEVFTAGLLAGLAAALGAALFVAVWPRKEESVGSQVFLLGIAFAVFASVAAVRAGTLVAFGAWPNPRRNALAQVAIGIACSFLVLTSALVACLLLEPAEGGARLSRFAFGTWLVLLPASGGVAAAFAKIDRDSPARDPLVGRAARPLSLLLAFPLALVLLGFTVANFQRDWDVSAPPGEPYRITTGITSVPRFEPFRVDFRQEVRAEIPEEVAAYFTDSFAGSGRDLQLALYKGNDETSDDCGRGSAAPLATADDPPSLSLLLEPGYYCLQVTPATMAPSQSGSATSTSFSEAFSTLFERVSFLERTGRVTDTESSLVVTLNADRAAPLKLFSPVREGRKRIPYRPKDTEAGSWRIEQMPAAAEFTVTQRRRVLARVPQEVELIQRGERPKDEADLVLELWSGAQMIDRADDPPSIERDLLPGNYRLVARFLNERPPADSASRGEDVVNPLKDYVLDFIPRVAAFGESTPSVEPGEHLVGYWPITETPYTRSFTVQFKQTVRANIPQEVTMFEINDPDLLASVITPPMEAPSQEPGSAAEPEQIDADAAAPPESYDDLPDLVLALRRGDELLAIKDRPDISMELEPGEYTLVVGRMFAQSDNRMPEGYTLDLELNAPEVRPAGKSN